MASLDGLDKPDYDGLVRLAALRGIVASGQHGEVDGARVDVFTASHIVQVHDKLSAEAQQVFRRMPLKRQADVAFDLSLRQTRSRSRSR